MIDAVQTQPHRDALRSTLEMLGRIPSSRVFGWVYCVWAVAITERYILRAIGSAWAFFISVPDVEWFAGWLLLVILLLVACALFRPRMVTIVYAVLLVAAATAMLGFGHLIAPFAIAAAALSMASCAGRLLIRPLFDKDEPPSRIFLYGLPVGVTLFSIVTLGLGLDGLLNTTACWIMFAGGAAAVAATFRTEGVSLAAGANRWLTKKLRECSRESALLLTVMGSLALFNFVWAAAPEIEYDALNYHLAVPQLYLEHHRVLELPFYHSYFVHNLEMFFTWMMALGGAEAVKFAMFGFTASAAWATHQLGSATFGRRAGLWAAALFYTTPLVGWESGTVYTDNVMALFAACALLAVARWLETSRLRVLVAAAALTGVAVGAKLNSVFAFVAAAPVTLWQAFRYARHEYRQTLRALMCAAAVFAIAAMPCYALFWWYTGNPIFPLLNGVFGSPKWALENNVTNWAGTARTASFLVRFPFRLTLDTRRFEFMPNGALGFSLLLAFPFVFLLLASRRKGVRLLSVSALAYVVLVFYTMQYARYVLPILPVMSVLGAGLSVYLSDVRAAALLRISLFAGMVFQFPVRIGMHTSFDEAFPFGAATGAEKREDFATRALPGYSAAMYLNRVARPNDGVLTAGLENMRYYLKPSLRTPYLSVIGDRLRDVQQALPDADVHKILRECGISWVLLNQSQINQAPLPWQPYLKSSFVARYAKLEFTDRGVSVYRLVEGQ